MKGRGNGKAGRRSLERGNSQPRGGARQDQGYKRGVGSPSVEPSGVELAIVVEEAEVVAVEAHPKRPGMYRLGIRLFGAHDGHTTIGPESDEPETEDWNAEVDALIAGAGSAIASEQVETLVTVHEDTLVSMRLLKGRKLSPDEWEGLKREQNQEDAYRASLAILERKARTSRELSEALKRKGYAADVIASCVQRLQSRRMLDDSSYARRFAEQRVTGQRKGRRLIRQELLQRGIAKEDADRALGELDADVEREAAFALARKKWPQIKGEPRERKMKLAAFLMRRGYLGGVVNEAIRRTLDESAREDIGDDEFPYDSDDLNGGAGGWEE